MPVGAPKGNQNAKNGTVWKDAIRKAVMQKKGDQLRKLADKLIKKAEEGDISALKEIGDRLDGRAAQQIIHSGDEDNPIQVIERKIIK